VSALCKHAARFRGHHRYANDSKLADKLFSLKYCFHCREQVASSASFHDITLRTQFESFFDHIRRRFLGDENYFRMGNKLAYLSSCFNPIQSGEADIEQDQIRVEFFSFADCG